MKKVLFTIIAILSLAIPQPALADWSDYVIILDPGHGGDDCGAVYNGGSYGEISQESYLVMRCAASVYNKLVGHGANVYVTRSLYDDNFDGEVDLSPRRQYCYTYGSDVFVSFHLNAANASAHGTESYYSADYSSNSYSLAYTMQTALMSKTGFGGVNGHLNWGSTAYELIDRGVKSANYSVIIAGESYPSTLTEGLFIDYVGDWQLIKDDNTSNPGFSAWVDGHLKGIYDYLYAYGNLTTYDETGLYYQGTSSGSSSSSLTTINASGETENIVPLSCKVGETASYTVYLDGSGLNYWTTATVSEAAKAIGISLSQSGFPVDGSTHTFNPEKPALTINFTPKQAGTWTGQWDTGTGGYDSDYYIHINCPEDVNGEAKNTWVHVQCTASEPENTISALTSDIDLSCRLGESVSQTVQIYGKGLASDVTIASTSPDITVSPTTLAYNSETGTFADGNPATITITYTPSAAGSGTINNAVTISGTTIDSSEPKSSSINVNYTVESPKITPSVSSLALVCPEGQTINREITIDGFGLASSVAATLSEGAKSVGISISDEHGESLTGEVVLNVTDHQLSDAKLKIKFTPAGTIDPGDTFTINLSATGIDGNPVNATVTLKCTVTTAELPLQEAWNYSEKLGNTIVDFGNGTYDVTKIRNMEFYSGLLFCVYDNSRIRVLDARNKGFLFCDLSNEGVSGGAAALADVKAFDGKIIASNIITSSSVDKTLKIYIWDNPTDFDHANDAPRVVSIDVADLFTTEQIERIGDYIECDGTWDDGHIIVSGLELYNSKYYPMIYQYKVSNGEISTTNLAAVEPYSLESDGTTKSYHVSGISMRATPTSYGFMLEGASCLPTKIHYNHSGYADGLIADQMMNYQNYGNAYRQFEYPVNDVTNTYAFMLDYNAPQYDAENNIISGTTYLGGHMKLLKIINGTSSAPINWDLTFKQPSHVGTFPYEGLSDNNQNINCTGNICVNTDSKNYLEVWVLCANQGLAFYRLGQEIVSDIHDVATSPNEALQVKSIYYYNPMGQRSATPFSGINIIVKTLSDGSTQVTKEIR